MLWTKLGKFGRPYPKNHQDQCSQNKPEVRMVVGSFTAPFISLRPASSLTWLTMCWNCGKRTNNTSFMFLFFYQCKANEATNRKETLTIIIRVCTGWMFPSLAVSDCQCLVYKRKEPNCTFNPSRTEFRSFQVHRSWWVELRLGWCVVPCKLCWLYFD